MSELAGRLQAGDTVNVTYYRPVWHGTIQQHRDAGVYKAYRGVTLLDVWTRTECSPYCEDLRRDDPDYRCPLGEQTCFSFKDPHDRSCGGISYGNTGWADVEYADTDALW